MDQVLSPEGESDQARSRKSRVGEDDANNRTKVKSRKQTNIKEGTGF
jgi:hypothetical protein